MLDTFRKHSNSTLIYLVFGALIFVFAVSFGQGSQGWKQSGVDGSTEYAAKVNDETISITDFNRQYRVQLANIEARAGQPISGEMADQLGFKKQALDALVNTRLLVQAAKQRGLHVGDEELAREITKVTAFQKDGVFDGETYQNILDREGTTKGNFEEKERESLLAQKMAALVSGAASISDADLRAEYDKEHDKADITFVRFSPAMFTSEVKAEPTDAEVDKYAAEHGAQIEDFYRRNSYRYHKPQQYQARSILLKAAEGGSPDDDAKAKARADQAEAALKSGKSFAEVAKEFSDDGSTKDKGGELGVFSPASLDKRLDEAVSKTQPGQTTEPVRTHFGYQIVQVEKVIPAEDKKLEDVKKAIAAELIKTEAGKAVAKQKAEAALAAAQGGKKLSEQFPPPPEGDNSFAAATKLQAQDTGPFALNGDYVPKLGQVPEIAQAAFALTAEKPVAGKVFEQGNLFYVVELKSREKPNDADFAKSKDELREALLQRKQNDLLSGFLKELRDEGKVEENQALVMPGRSAQS